MPFESKRQQRAAFGGHIPGISKKKAKEWADKTDFDKIPERVKSEKGKPTLRSKKAQVLPQAPKPPGRFKRKAQEMFLPMVDPFNYERSMNKKSALDLMFQGFAKLATGSRDVARFDGAASPKQLKPPGKDVSKQAINPRRNLKQSITAFMSD